MFFEILIFKLTLNKIVYTSQILITPKQNMKFVYDN